jgi:serine/threonine protein phosphatase PrpC
MPISEFAPALDDPTADYPIMTDSHPSRVAIHFGALTHPGKVRDTNEDHFLIARLAKTMQVCKTSLPGDGKTQVSEEEGHLIVVADGMGGAAAGERASALAVESVESFVQNTLQWFLHLGGRDEHVLLSELREGLERADRTLIERAQNNPALRGMGTTLTMAYCVGPELFIVHAGDSRAYLFRDGELDQLTNDHTLVQALVDDGVISSEQARRHARRHVVTNVIGGPRPGVFVEIHKLVARDGDRLLFCSDGLTEPVDDATIAEVLRDQPDPQACCNCLVDLALRGGGPDNVTALVARYQVQV